MNDVTPLHGYDLDRCFLKQKLPEPEPEPEVPVFMVLGLLQELKMGDFVGLSLV